MKKILTIFIMAMVLCSVIGVVSASHIGGGIGVDINTQPFIPKVFLCDNRTTTDDNLQNGNNGLNLSERKHNYAFEGEQIHWKVLVIDKNKIDGMDVVASLTKNLSNGKEVECSQVACGVNASIDSTCNARADQYVFTTCDPRIMSYYDCTFTVETPNSMYGEYFISVDATDVDGDTGTMNEQEYWFLNPLIALTVSAGPLSFPNVMPGTNAYSQTILVGNGADGGSGVMLDMFISGTDFYDTSSSGARCPTTNQLALTNFRYSATNGAFSSTQYKNDTTVETDIQGYTAIPYGNDITSAKRIIRYNKMIGAINCNDGLRNSARGGGVSSTVVEKDWNCGNALSPGSEMALTFKLSMPEPCIGDFNEGSINFWGEAI